MSGQLLHFVRLKAYERSRRGVLSDAEEEGLEWLIRLNPEAYPAILVVAGSARSGLGLEVLANGLALESSITS